MTLALRRSTEVAANLIAQSAPEPIDFDALAQGSTLTGVVSGMGASVTGSSMVVTIASGVVRIGSRRVIYAGGTVTAVTDATNPRRAMISINTAGTLAITHGTAAANPYLPNASAIPANSVVLWAVDMPAATSALTSAMLTDKRVPVPDVTWFNVKDYGAVGGNWEGTADAAAFDACIAAALASATQGPTVYIPEGRYWIQGNLATITLAGSKGIRFVGDGRYNSVLSFGTSNTRGLYINSTSTVPYNKPAVEIAHLGFVSLSKNNGTAIRIDFADAVTTDQSFNIYDCAITPDYYSTSDQGADYGYWTEGIQVNNARNGSIRNCQIYGDFDVSTAGVNRSTYGIRFLGESITNDVVGCSINEFVTGVLGSGTMEGFYVIDNDIIACDNGVVFDPTSAGEPQALIFGNSFATTTIGIEINDAMGFQIIGNYLYCVDWGRTSGWPNWTGIKVGTGGLWGNISANNIVRQPTPTGITTTGIALGTIDICHVTDNIFFAYGGASPVLTNGITIAATATNVRLLNNSFNQVTNQYVNSGPSTQIEHYSGSAVDHTGTGDYKFRVIGSTSGGHTLRDSGSGADLKDYETLTDGGVTIHRALTDAAALKYNFHRMQHSDGLTWNANEAMWIEPADRASVSVITDVFSSPSAVPLIAGQWYEFEYEVWYQKGNTAAICTFTLTWTNAPQNANAQMFHSPAAGVTNTASATTQALMASVEGITATTLTLVTPSQTASTLQSALIKGTFQANATTGGNVRLRITGTNVAVQKGSKQKVRRRPQTTGGWANTDGAFVA